MTAFPAPTPQCPDDGALEAQIRRAEPCWWINPACTATPEPGAVTALQIDTAVQRFARAQNLLQRVFPALRETGGRIASPLLRASALQQALGLNVDEGQLWIQCDHLLPVAGSVKAPVK